MRTDNTIQKTKWQTIDHWTT